MRAGAEIRELSLRIHRNGGILRQIADEFYFVVLTLFLKELKCFRTTDLFALKGKIFLNDFLHLFFNMDKICLAEFFIHIKIIVESVVNGRANRQLHMLIRIQALHGLRQNMRSGMPQCPAAVGIIKSKELDGTVFVQNRRQILRLPVYFGCQNFLCQTVAHTLNKIQKRFPGLKLAYSAIFHRNL